MKLRICQEIVNDKTAAFANAYPERLIGFMSLHPHDPRMRSMNWKAMRGDLGLRGIKDGRQLSDISSAGGARLGDL